MTFGPSAIVGACSLITKDVLPDTVVAEIPARIIYNLDGYFDHYRKNMIQVDVDNQDEIRNELPLKILESFKAIESMPRVLFVLIDGLSDSVAERQLSLLTRHLPSEREN